MSNPAHESARSAERAAEELATPSVEGQSESGERSPAEILQEAHDQWRTGRYEQAAVGARRAIELGLAHWGSHMILGLSLQAIDRPEEAETALRRAHQLAPARIEPATALLEVVVARHGTEAAIALHRSMTQVDQDRALRATLAKTLTKHAHRSFADRRLLEAEAACLGAVAIEESAEIQHLLGHLRRRKGEHQRAVAAAKRAQELGLEHWTNYYLLGLSLTDIGRLEEAEAALRHALDLAPARTEVAAALLEVVAARDGTEAARRQHQVMTRAQPGSAFDTILPRALKATARRLLANGKVLEAEAACLEALAIEDAADVHHLLAQVRVRSEQHEQAAAAANRAIELGLEDWGNYYCLGVSLKALSRLEPAEAALRKALDLAPTRPQLAVALLEIVAARQGMEAARALHFSMAQANRALRSAWPRMQTDSARRLIADGKLPEAEAACLDALAAGEMAETHHVLANLRLQSGQHEQALASASRAIELGLRDWSNYLFLGLSLKALNRDEAALEAFAVARSLSPSRAEAAEPYLETMLKVKGPEEAAVLYEDLRRQMPRIDWVAVWSRLIGDYAPASIASLILQGRIDQAEAECRRVASRYSSRRAALWAEYIQSYRRWLSFTRRSPDGLVRSAKPKLSVFLITYNHEKYVAQALEGILNQETEYEVEINAIDDCSGDRTQEIILGYQARYPGRIHTYFNPTNIGTLDPPQQKVTYNGFKTLKGDYIAILEGDDYWTDPRKVQKQISFLENNPLYAACSHNTIKIYEDNSQPPHRFLYWPSSTRTYTIDNSAEMNVFFHTSSIVYRNLLLGVPPEGFKSKWSVDIFFTAAHLRHGELFHIDEDMSVYRAHGGGSYSTMNALKQRMFNIEGQIRYNHWLGYKYLKGYSFSVNRLTLALLQESTDGRLPPLTWRQRLRYRAMAAVSALLYDLLDRRPRLDPAVFYYGEPPKPSRPRAASLAEYGIAERGRFHERSSRWSASPAA